MTKDRIAALTAERDETLNQLDSARHSVDVLERRIEALTAERAAERARADRAGAERDEWKQASTRHHPNPADHRYWEGRYRDEKARADAAETRVAVLEGALRDMVPSELKWREQGTTCLITHPTEVIRAARAALNKKGPTDE